MPASLNHKNNLEASGWTRRFTACEPQLSEAIGQYRESGFEVLLANLPSEKTGIDCIKNDEKYECRECLNGSEEKFGTIFTRPKNQGP